MFRVLISLKSQELNKTHQILSKFKILVLFQNNQKNRTIVILVLGNKPFQIQCNKHIKRIEMKEVNHNRILLKLILYMI